MDERPLGGTATAGVKRHRQEQLVKTIKAAVAEAVADKEERESEELRKAAKRKPSMSAFLVVVLLGFVASGLYCYFEIRAMSVPLDQEMGMEADAVGVHLYSVAMQLERFKQENGHYPDSLQRLGLPLEQALKYSLISDNEYSMQYVSEEVVRSYDSSQPESELLATTAILQH
jgi:hypothetical protein